MSKALTISIVNYNSREYILECLDSIYRNCQGLDIEVCVVDNNSSDDSVALIRESFPQVKLLLNDENGGFARGNNQVLRNLDSRYCLITNPDVIVEPGTLEKMVKFMDITPGAGAVGCRILSGDRSLQYSCRRYPKIVTILFRALLIDAVFPGNGVTRKYLMQDRSHDQAMAVDWLTGCCIMVRKETIDQVGLLDESYFMYFEDADLCYRVNKDWRVYYFPDASMIHEFQHKSRRIGNVKHTLHHIRSAATFFRKHGLNLNGQERQ